MNESKKGDNKEKKIYKQNTNETNIKRNIPFFGKFGFVFLLPPF